MDFTYILKRSVRRSICVQISEDEKIIVNAPIGISVSEVDKFIYSKRNWIKRHLERQRNQNALSRELGPLTADDIKQIKKKAKKLIPERVEYYSKLSGISYNRIFIRLQKTRWGSCSADGNLNFNCLLADMPLEILDSVVVHELCHRRHMNHSKAFYEEILKIFPEYKKCDKWLKQNGNAYFKRITD
ncbi:MAG: M48 family metallopeptidase [Treponema sp.]|nr:M48 family metallopeptidase [Treponema sp.]